MGSKRKAIIYVFICVALWALIPVVSKLGQVNLDNNQFLFWSNIVSFLAFLSAAIIVKQVKTFLSYTLKDWINIVLLGFLGTYLFYILLYFGYANAQGLEVLVLQYSWPIFIIPFSMLFLGEKLTFRRSISMFLGFLGVAFVLTKGNFNRIYLNNYYVDLLVIIAALSFALFSVLSKKVKIEPYTMITGFFLTGTIISFASMLCLSRFSLPTKATIIPILINGIFVNGYSYILWIKALKEAEASFIAPFVFLTPIIAAVYLIIFFHEPILPIYGFGLSAVVIGGLLNR